MNEELKNMSENSSKYLKEFSSEDYIFKNSVRQIHQFYRNIAWDNWINQNDLISFKNGLHNSILTLVRSNEYFKDLGSYMTLPRIPLCELALSDNQKLMQIFSNQDYEIRLSQTKFKLYSEIVELGGDQIYSALFLAAMKRDMSELNRLLKIIDCSKAKKLYFEDELAFYRGLLTNNKDLILDTISDISSTQNHKRTNSYNGIFKDFTSFPAIGYAKIAWINNYQIEFSNKYIDNALLPVSSNITYINEIDSIIESMTLESEYHFHTGAKRKIRNDVYDVFVFSTNDLSGKTCLGEDLIPNVYNSEANFIGLQSGNKYKSGFLISTHRKVDSISLFKRANKIKRIGFFNKKKVQLLLQKYLDEIDEISKTQRGIKVTLDENLSLTYEPIPTKSEDKPLKNLSKKRKDAIAELGRYCFDKLGYKKYVAEVKSLKNFDNHKDYGSTMNYLSSKIQEKGLLQFFSLDWKTEIMELDSLIEQSLKQNFNLKINMDISSKYSKQSSISENGCFTQFITKLSTYGMTMKILNSGGDNYIFLLHRIENDEEISRLLIESKFE